MDALWSLEDKWKISTRKAVALLLFTVTLFILVCLTIIVMILKKKAKRNRIACLNLDDDESESSSLVMYGDRSSCNKCTYYVKNVILGSACWSMAHKWTNHDELMVVKCKYLNTWKQRNVVSNCIKFSGCVGSKFKPVWQRPILMGGKCEFPKFSGLILYDERGRPLPHHHQHDQQQCANTTSHNDVGQLMEHYHGIEEDPQNIGRKTTLKDLL